MSFISNCPKCQKSVLVPDGHGHDAVVQCPACFVEYPLGEILSAAPPALIVVRAGSAATAASNTATLGEPALAAAAPALEGGLFSAHRVEPSLHDGDLLEFAGADVALEPHALNDNREIPFAQPPQEDAGLATVVGDDLDVAMEDKPADAEFAPFAEPPAAVEGEAIGAATEAGQETESGGDNWGSFGGEEPVPAEGEEGDIGVGERDESLEAEGLSGVNFAEITGKPASGIGAVGEGAAVVTAEPPKKKKRKREANPLVRAVGVIFFGLLALPCSLLLAKFVFHQQMDFLPDWMPAFFKTAKPATRTATTTVTPPAPSTSSSPADKDTAQPGAGATSITTTTTIAEGNPQPGTGAANTTPAPGPASPNGKPPAAAGNEIAMNEQPGGKPKAPASEESPEPTEPANPLDTAPKSLQPDKSDLAPPPVVGPAGSKPKSAAPDTSDPFAGSSPTPEKPKAEAPGKPEPTKPEPSKPDSGDPFNSPEPTAPKVEKPKTEIKSESADPFSTPAPTAPAGEKPKTEVKPEASKPEPAKPETGDPFNSPQPTAPKIEKPKTEVKPESTKPQATPPESADPFSTPAPAAPAGEKPKAEVKPEMAKPEATKPEPTKPEIEKPKLELPKPEAVKPGLKPEPIKPEVKPEPAKPAVGPLNGESFATGDLDAALKATPAGGSVDANAYAAWCKLADVATFTGGESAAQKQAVHDLVNKVAANPQASGAIAAAAKKLIDEKATKGGIVLAGKVSKIASRNGLFGTAIRMEGMANAVMVFSSHALGISEGQTVVVLGALVSDPVKNLPGYTGKQPVVVWAEFAQPAP